METQGNSVEPKTVAHAPKLSNVALRVALWVLYGGAAGEIVYVTKTIEEGMSTSHSGNSSRRQAA